MYRVVGEMATLFGVVKAPNREMALARTYDKFEIAPSRSVPVIVQRKSDTHGRRHPIADHGCSLPELGGSLHVFKSRQHLGVGGAAASVECRFFIPTPGARSSIRVQLIAITERKRWRDVYKRDSALAEL